MAQRTRTNGSSPFEAAVENIERELGKLQKQLKSGRRDLEQRIEKSRKQLISDVQKNPAFKRAVALRKDAERQIETGVENMLSAFQIASKRDVSRIDRRLKTINKKRTDMEKSA
jgi:hypothetical protein